MKLTAKKAVKLSIEQWTDLSETGGKKEDWEKWEYNGGKYELMSQNDCFLCEYRLNKGRAHDCLDVCPYSLKYKCYCDDGDTLYSKWDWAKTKTTRKKYAKIIRDLPVRRR